MSTEYLKELITRRRTRKPALFSKKVPDPDSIIQLIDTARHAPNHHSTEPARFYLLASKTIETVGQLFGEVVAGIGSDPVLVEKGERKKKEWGTAPGLLVVTCHTDRASVRWAELACDSIPVWPIVNQPFPLQLPNVLYSP